MLARVAGSLDHLRRAVARGDQIYGVTTLFGGMADRSLDPGQLAELQRLALWHHKSTTGPRLPVADVRAAMLLRANSLMKGVSGVRLEIVERFAAFLNAGAHPHVYQRGSIGASGDLVPLTYIAGAVMGLDPAFLVDLGGETLGAHEALARLGLAPLALEPKEGLALNNGTGASTGVAANALDRAMDLAALTLGIHALYAQALLATDQSFAPFIHAMKPHPGQIWVAARMAELLEGSSAIRGEAAGQRGHRAGKLIQDRYSLRCLPQYLGPVFDGIAAAARQIETEANCANDNPLIDPDSGEIYHTGNFLAQYTGVAMDQLRYHLGLLAKHVDVQIALLMTPEFSGGLSASLVGNQEGGLNVGLKSLQVGGNQMMPLISFYGQSIVDRFPTHAEQFNQNINSQAMNSANLARESARPARTLSQRRLALRRPGGRAARAADRRQLRRAGHPLAGDRAPLRSGAPGRGGSARCRPAAALERSRRIPPAQGRRHPRRHPGPRRDPCGDGAGAGGAAGPCGVSGETVTCLIRYRLARIDAFALYAKAWVDLINRHGGRHH